jgi:hypothetical protein
MQNTLRNKETEPIASMLTLNLTLKVPSLRRGFRGGFISEQNFTLAGARIRARACPRLVMEY